MLVEGVLCGEHFVTNLTSKPHEARPLPHHRRGRRLHRLQNIRSLGEMPLRNLSSYTENALRALINLLHVTNYSLQKMSYHSILG